MSWVWNVMLSFSNEELWDEEEFRETCEPLKRINAWIEDGKLVDLTKPTYAKNAGSGLEANLYGGGFQHFDIEEFIKVVEAQDWKDRANLQLWVKAEEQDSFTPLKLRFPRVKPRQPKSIAATKPKAKSQPQNKRKGRHR